jgi:hypothetical protein
MHGHLHALQGLIARRVAIDAARMLDHLAGFLEKRPGTLRIVGDRLEFGRRPKRRGYGIRLILSHRYRRNHGCQAQRRHGKADDSGF